MVPVYDRAMANAEASYGASHPTAIAAAYKLAGIHRQAADFLSAESLYIDTIRLHSDILEEGDPALIVPLSDFGTLYLENGHYDFAGDVLLEALVIAQENYGFDDISTTGLLQQFATLYMFQEKYEDAEITLQRVRGIVEEAYGTDDPRLRPVLEQTGSLYMEMGRDEEAGLLLSEDQCLQENGHYDFAGDVLLEALVIAQENYGFDDISTTGLLQQFATLYMFQEKYEDAEITLQRVRGIVEEAYGTDDPRLRPVLEQTGSLYMEMGRDEEAGLLLSEAAALPLKTP